MFPKKFGPPYLASLLFVLTFSQGGNPALADQPQTAEAFFKQGISFKAAGRIEDSRKALQHAIMLDKNGPIGKNAAIYIRARLTKVPVTPVMEIENATSYNHMVAGQTAVAISEMLTLQRKYPNFEWPFGNLGYLYMTQRRYKAALPMLTRAVTINPYYANAWNNLSECHRALGDQPSAQKCRQRALTVLPSELGGL